MKNHNRLAVENIKAFEMVVALVNGRNGRNRCEERKAKAMSALLFHYPTDIYSIIAMKVGIRLW